MQYVSSVPVCISVTIPPRTFSVSIDYRAYGNTGGNEDHFVTKNYIIISVCCILFEIHGLMPLVFLHMRTNRSHTCTLQVVGDLNVSTYCKGSKILRVLKQLT